MIQAETSIFHNERKDNPSSSLLGKYQPEIIYGGIDGSITTFAVVSGATGAGFKTEIIIILGIANLLADGLSMSVSSYLASKAEKHQYEKHRKSEVWSVENKPEEEKDEIRKIYESKGFTGSTLDEIVEVITSSKRQWVDEMMKDELKMMESAKSPLKKGSATYLSFIAIGLIPLLAYGTDLFMETSVNNLFFISSTLTFLTFILIGYFKAHMNQVSRVKGILETVFLGGLASLIAFFSGKALEFFITINTGA